MKSKATEPQVVPSRIVDMASSFYESCTLFAASDLGVFAALAELGPSSAGRVAEKCKLDARGARLLLDACVALGLIEKNGDLYGNSREAALFLVPGAPGDLSGAIRYNRDVYAAWGRLAGFVRSGAPVERPELHLGEDRDRTRTFVLSMHGRALGIGRTIVPLLKLEGRKQLLDMGGGPGTYSVLIAKANPGLNAVVLDLPEVVKIASELIAAESMQDRVAVLPGDYHTAPLPGGNDVVNFFGVLHQESPDSIRALMKRAFDAMAPGGLVHVLDMMTDATRARPRFSALFAVNMALTTENGWVFSDAELKEWMEAAGFVEFHCGPLPAPTQMPHWLATARKPGTRSG